MDNKTIYIYFLKHFKDNDFQKFLEKEHKERAIIPSVENEYSKLGSQPAIYEIKFFDTVDNSQMNKLVKNIYNLPTDKYKCHHYYKKPAKLKKRSYITIKYDMSSYGGLADIEVLNDDYISRIEVLCSSLDSWRYFLEYRFIFKKDINASYDDLIENELLKNYKNDTLIKYMVFDKPEDNYSWIESLYKEVIYIILERFIKKLHYKKHMFNLSSMDVLTYQPDYNFKQFVADYMERVFINTKDNYAIRTESIHNRMYLVAGKNRVPNVHISKHIMDYGISYYYFFFGEDELIESKHILNPVVSDIKSINTPIMEHMFKRLNAVQNQEINNDFFFNRFKNDGWICKRFESKKPVDIKEFLVHDFKAFYNNYYLYCKTLLELKNTSIAKWLSIIAIAISIIGIVLSVIFTTN